MNSVILENFKIFVKDANGICILKKFISSNKSDKLKNDIYIEIKKNIFETMKDPFGNYIVQMIIDVRKIINLNI
jgi:hypothetical protein